jgi:hypothetical protein
MAHMDGLLHLSALAAAVAIAYVGLDRIHWDDERFITHLNEARTAIARSILRFGIRIDQLNPKEAFELFPFFVRLKLFVLCHVGGARAEMGWWCRLCHTIHVQFQVPLLSYFRTRRDKWIISRLALLAIIIFLYLSAVATWDLDSFPWPRCEHHFVGPIDVCTHLPSAPMELVAPYFYWLSTGILLWVCITGAASQRLQRIRMQCDRLDAEVQERVNRMTDLVTRFLPTNVQEQTANTQNQPDQQA